MSVLTDNIKNAVRTGVQLSGEAIVVAATMVPYVGPILKFPIINALFKWCVNWVISKLQLQPFLQNLFVDLAIDIQVNAQNHAAEQAKVALQAALKKRTPKEVQNASDDFDRRYADLIRIRP